MWKKLTKKQKERLDLYLATLYLTEDLTDNLKNAIGDITYYLNKEKLEKLGVN